VALVHLVARLRAAGATLLDTQFVTPHLQSLGAVEIPRAEYHRRLDEALGCAADFYVWPKEEPISGARALAALD
jgi:leucyl/phenylalanyl-tRNA--protein transferase